MAFGIAHFWWKWFHTEHTELWLFVSYVEHERVRLSGLGDVIDDGRCCRTLALQTSLWASPLTLICGGMMLFLAVIDTVYFYQHGMFRLLRATAWRTGDW